MIGAHKWISSWQPAVEKYQFELVPVSTNLIDNIWKDDSRIRNQEPLEILDIEFSGILSYSYACSNYIKGNCSIIRIMVFSRYIETHNALFDKNILR